MTRNTEKENGKTIFVVICMYCLNEKTKVYLQQHEVSFFIKHRAYGGSHVELPISSPITADTIIAMTCAC